MGRDYKHTSSNEHKGGERRCNVCISMCCFSARLLGGRIRVALRLRVGVLLLFLFFLNSAAWVEEACTCSRRYTRTGLVVSAAGVHQRLAWSATVFPAHWLSGRISVARPAPQVGSERHILLETSELKSFKSPTTQSPSER